MTRLRKSIERQQLRTAPHFLSRSAWATTSNERRFTMSKILSFGILNAESKFKSKFQAYNTADFTIINSIFFPKFTCISLSKPDYWCSYWWANSSYNLVLRGFSPLNTRHEASFMCPTEFSRVMETVYCFSHNSRLQCLFQILRVFYQVSVVDSRLTALFHILVPVPYLILNFYF